MLLDNDFFITNFEVNQLLLNNYEINNEKLELFKSFTLILLNNIDETFLGDDILMSSYDVKNHFEWSFNQTINNFEKENIFFKKKGFLFMFLNVFFLFIFYLNKNRREKNMLIEKINLLFDLNFENEFMKKNFFLAYNLFNNSLTNGNS